MARPTSSTPLGLLTLKAHLDDLTNTTEPASNLTLAELRIFGSTTILGPDEIEILPSQIAEMYATKVTIIPSAIVLLISCSILCVTIFTYFKRVIKLYIGLVFYAITELLLFLRILLFYLLSAQGSLEMVPCGVTKSLSLFTMTLPGLAILLITISRLIFIRYPLRYRNILLIKYQLISCVVAVFFAVMIALWPALGACDPYYDRIYGICYLDCDSICYGYIAIYVTLGILLPTLVVIGIYIYVYKVLKKHRARAKNRENSLQGQVDHSPGFRKDERSRSSDDTPSIPRITVSDSSQASAGITIVNKVSLTLDNDPLSLNNISIQTETNLIFTKFKDNNAYMTEQIREDKTRKKNSDLVITNVSVLTPMEIAAFAEKDHEETAKVSQRKGNDSFEQVYHPIFDEKMQSPSYEKVDLVRASPAKNHSLEKSPPDHESSQIVNNDRQPPAQNTIFTNPLHCDSSASFSSELEYSRSKDFSLHGTSSANLLSPDWHKRLEIRKESARLCDIRRIKPIFKEAVRRLSIVTENTDQLRKKEIPWPLVLLTLIHITSSIPWILIIIFQRSVDMFTSSNGRIWLDLGNALLLCSVGVSPLLYVMFTRLIRDKVWQIIKKCGRRIARRFIEYTVST